MHSGPFGTFRMWIGTLFEVCTLVLCCFLHDKRSVLQSALDTDQTAVHYRPPLQLNIKKRAYLRKSFSPFTPLFAPGPLCNIFRTTPLALIGISMASPRFFPLASDRGRLVCIPRRTTFEIHFQVNMLWPAANLQPTGVVTAVADNGQNKPLLRSGMFTVVTGTVLQTFLHLLFGKREGDPVIGFTQLNRELNPLALLCRIR